MRIQILYTVIFSLILFSCKKQQKLPETLIGEWEWKYSTIKIPQYDQYGNFTHFELGDTIFKGNENYSANFSAKINVSASGSLTLSKDGNKLARIKYRSMYYDENQNNSFSYYLIDYVKDKAGEFSYISLSGYENSTKITVRGFPYFAEINTSNMNELSIFDEAVDSITITSVFEKN